MESVFDIKDSKCIYKIMSGVVDLPDYKITEFARFTRLTNFGTKLIIKKPVLRAFNLTISTAAYVIKSVNKDY